MKIALGPLQYYWPVDTVHAFYEEITGSAADIVYLGEVVCSRRRGLRPDDWLAIGRRLSTAGKAVVLSTQALIESEADLRMMRKVVANGLYRVEANDWGAVRLLHDASIPFVAGPHLNIYNPAALKMLGRLGATRWVAPVEITRTALAGLQDARPQNLETEIFSFGRAPLAFSARCFTARHHNLPKDNCGFVCRDYPKGLDLATRDGRPFLSLNGIQTQSEAIYNLVAEAHSLCGLGVDVLRVSPQPEGTVAVLELFRHSADGKLVPPDAMKQVQDAAPGHHVNGFWHDRPGMELVPGTAL